LKTELFLGNKTLTLPAFFTDATRGFVRSASAADAKAAGVQGMEMSTWHLLGSPGPSLVKAAGGLHAFSGWDGPILTDSGGFQAYSLIAKDPSKGRIDKNGITYKDERRGKKVELTPARCISAQMDMGADIVMCLDCCTEPAAPRAEQEQAVELTVRWAKACREEFDKRTQGRAAKPLLFGIIQGGNDMDLRRQCADALVPLGFDGYGFGGWPMDREGNLLYDLMLATAALMPEGAVKYAMGLGRPDEIVRLHRSGYVLFDCVIPTREARHAKLYAFNGKPLTEGFYDAVYINKESMARDFRPIEPGCPCEACQNHSRAFVHHLFACEDPLGLRLATVHNLSFYARLMGRIADEC
jgi:queuine tRNA-ribosyltransferase